MNKVLFLVVTIGLFTLTFLKCNEIGAQSVWFDELELDNIEHVVNEPKANKNIHSKQIKIHGRIYEHGIGLEAHCTMYLKLFNSAKTLSGILDYDQTQEYHPAACKIKMFVIGNDKILWTSSELGFFSNSEPFKVDLTGVDTLQIWILGNKGNFRTATNIADARIDYSNRKPEFFIPEKSKPYILTPKAPAHPRINNPKKFGAKPGSPFVYKIAVTGREPVLYSAKGLPESLQLNEKTGIITGKINKTGSYKILLEAKNEKGIDTATVKFEVGNTLVLTPPMGWSSWNVWGESIDQKKVYNALTYMKAYKLDQYGWNYINIDDGWQGPRGGKYNALMPNTKFPDIQSMIDSIHASGFYFGIYSSPWKTTYAGLFGASKSGYMGSSSDNPDGTNDISDLQFGVYPFHDADVRQWSDWGVDFVKYDWWPNDVPHTKAMSMAIQKSNRNIVFSISNAAPFENAGKWAELTNLWRTTGDILNSWPAVLALGYAQDKWSAFSGPGHWNDPDMLVLGHTGIAESIKPSRLSADEQYAHISLWAMLSAPLIFGFDLSQADEFTISLLTNNEVIAINQDILGKQATCVQKDNLKEVYVKDLADGTKAVALFNRGLSPAKICLDLNTIGFKGKTILRDVWRQSNMGVFTNTYITSVNGHGVILLKLEQKNK